MTKQENKYCPYWTQYSYRNSLSEAMKSCRSDASCKAIFSSNCEVTETFALCRSTENMGNGSIGSCVYTKNIGND